jgi:urea transport system permease protein
MFSIKLRVCAKITSELIFAQTLNPQVCPMMIYRFSARIGGCLIILAFLTLSVSVDASPARTNIVEALLAEDVDEQIGLLRKLVESDDAVIPQLLSAWRQGEIYVHAPREEMRIPFTLDAAQDADGKARGLAVADGLPLKDAAGQPLLFLATEIESVETSSKLRRAIKTTMDLLAINNPDPQMRRDAVMKLGQDQNLEYLPYFELRLETEKVPEVRRALAEATHITRLVEEAPEAKLDAVRRLGEMRSIASLSFLQALQKEVREAPEKFGGDLAAAVSKEITVIDQYMFFGNLVGTAFRGLSLSAVLLVVALGLAITFGLMGVINMAHGEIMMVGAYAAFVTQNYFKGWFGASGFGFDLYFIAALVVAFLAAALMGLLLERSVIRFLYSRPLESLLATWGVSLVLQQLFRTIFGAANVQVSSPSWLSGSFVVSDVLFAYNRIFVIGFAVFIVFGTYLILTRTSMGLQVRAVMQNRAMASCLGVRTNRVNMVTFAFGSGLAGAAGACLSQIGNVGPSLGQNYIVDCFMIVVLGGVGNLVGTVVASLGVGVTDQILQPFLGAVMGKITVLAAIILFLQWRPAGLFVTRSRSLEG